MTQDRHVVLLQHDLSSVKGVVQNWTSGLISKLDLVLFISGDSFQKFPSSRSSCIVRRYYASVSQW